MAEFESGILMGFENHQFVLRVLDEKFVEEEIKALQRKSCTLSYVSKGVIDLFLINVDDSLETSDVPFCVHDFKEDQEFVRSLDEKENYKITVEYIDATEKVIATRTGTLDTSMSQCLREHFKSQLTQDFDEESYEASYFKIQSKYEPFELEEQATAVCKI